MTDHGDLAADALLAASLVREAGTLAARLRAGDGDLGVARKTAVADVVTEADTRAEAMIAARLAEERPADGVQGEEDVRRAGSSGRRWVVDPVDGTWNFVHGLDWWCSALALVGPADAGAADPDAEGLRLGAVHHAASGHTWVGGPGLPATCDGEPLPLLPDRSLAEVGVATYLHPPWLGTEVGEAFTRATRGAATLRMLGCGSMDAVAVARGDVGVTVQHTVAAWDRLPGLALIRSVGGVGRQVDAAGKTWSVAGAPTAVAEVCAALAD